MKPRRLEVVRTVAALVAFGSILVGAFQPFYLQVLFRDRAALSQHLTALRFGRAPELRGLLYAVREQTEPGAQIALVTPVHRWDEGYAYAYYRASYVLAGRVVVPLVTRMDEPVPENIRFAEYVVTWKTELEMPQFEKIWQSEAGALYRRAM
jgi:hypothetical protein